jgi:hypothetical protein
MHVQAEVKANTGDQDMVYRLCNSPEAIAAITQLYSFLRTQYWYTARVGAFMTIFPVYALGLESGSFSLEEMKRIATWLNQADARAKRNMQFYTTYTNIFLPAQRAMHEFCITNNIDPCTVGSE